METAIAPDATDAAGGLGVPLRPIGLHTHADGESLPTVPLVSEIDR